MIAKRIPHKAQCDHAQTPYARRKCRAGKLAAAKKETIMRYTVQKINGKFAVLDNGTPMGSLYTNDSEQIAATMAANLNANDGQPAETATAPKPGRAGWSNAARRWAGRTERSHPFGRAVEAGAGYTVYEDTAFGGGRVQIWDRS